MAANQPPGTGRGGEATNDDDDDTTSFVVIDVDNDDDDDDDDDNDGSSSSSNPFTVQLQSSTILAAHHHDAPLFNLNPDLVSEIGDVPPQLPPLAISSQWDDVLSLSQNSFFLNWPTDSSTFASSESSVLLPPPVVLSEKQQHKPPEQQQEQEQKQNQRQSQDRISNQQNQNPNKNTQKQQKVQKAQKQYKQHHQHAISEDFAVLSHQKNHPQFYHTSRSRATTSPSSETRHDPHSPKSPTSSRQSHSSGLVPAQKSAGEAETRSLVADGLVVVENFSRPRKASSIRQYQLGAIAPPPLEPIMMRPLLKKGSSAVTGPMIDGERNENVLRVDGQRSREPSVSSANSTATFASAPILASNDFRDHKGWFRNRDGSQPPPSLAYRPHQLSGHDRVDGPPAPWLTGDETRSSFRSQLTASTATGTNAEEERSSVVTNDSSVSSLLDAPAAHEEPSVEDVMCMYETGFDDTEPEDGGDELDKRGIVDDDVDDYAMPRKSWSEPYRPGSEPAFQRSQPLPIGPLLKPRNRDSSAVFRNPGLALSVPENIGTTITQDRAKPKRDSGKSLRADTATAALTVNTSTSTTASATTRPSSADSPDLRDRYGFRKGNQYFTAQQYDAWNEGYAEYLLRRKRKWTGFLRENGLMTNRPNRFPPRSAKTKRFIRKGIPPEWRGAAWFYYAGGPEVLAKNFGVYERLLGQKAKDIDIEAIERDLHRTFPDNIRFKPSSGTSATPTTDDDDAAEPSSSPTTPDTPTTPSPDPANYGPPETPIISSLRRVLLAFSIHNPKIGYCQSLNFLAGLLLLFVESEEHCFWLLSIITHEFLPGTHEFSLEGSKVDLGVLMASLYEVMPDVWGKIAADLDGDPVRPPTGSAKSVRRGRSLRTKLPPVPGPSDRLPPITLCMTAWFMSCFIGTLPIETTLRVWDVLFYEGSKTLFRIALAIFKIGEADIAAVSDPMEMFGVIQTLPRRLIDANGVLDACFKRRNGFGHLSQQTTEARRRERRMQVQMEKACAEGVLEGSVTEAEVVVRKGTLFGRKKVVVRLGELV